jgi:hypothetical protein
MTMRSGASANQSLDALSQFFTQPGAALLSADTAARFGLKVGERLTLRVESNTRSAVLVGLLRRRTTYPRARSKG